MSSQQASNNFKILLGIASAWLCFCLIGCGYFYYYEQHKPQWEKDFDEAESDFSDNPEHAARLYERSIDEAVKANVPFDKRLNVMVRQADLLFASNHNAEALAAYKKCAEIARNCKLTDQVSEILVNEALAWHGAYRENLADLPDPAIVQTALSMRSANEQRPSNLFEHAFIALGQIYTDRENYKRAEKNFKKAIAESKSLKDEEVQKDGWIGLIIVAVERGQNSQANKLFLDAYSSAADLDKNSLRTEFYKLMREKENANSELGPMESELPELLKAGKYSELDKRYKDYLSETEELASGRLLVDCFFAFLDTTPGDASLADWNVELSKFYAWVEQCPDSQAAKIAYANKVQSFLSNYKIVDETTSTTTSLAENATSSEQQIIAKYTIASARNVLKSEVNRTPNWYLSSLYLCQVGDWDGQKYDDIYDECRTKFPLYKQAVFNKANVLLNTNHGTGNDARDFLEKECKKLSGENANILYAQTAKWLETEEVDDVMHVANLSYDRIQKGLHSMIHTHKHWLAGRAALSIFACQSGDTTTARAAFDE